MPQLQCVGGAAAGKWEPEEVACTKSFTDGRDVYWKCEADMPDLYKYVTRLVHLFLSLSLFACILKS